MTENRGKETRKKREKSIGRKGTRVLVDEREKCCNFVGTWIMTLRMGKHETKIGGSSETPTSPPTSGNKKRQREQGREKGKRSANGESGKSLTYVGSLRNEETTNPSK